MASDFSFFSSIFVFPSHLYFSFSSDSRAQISFEFLILICVCFAFLLVFVSSFIFVFDLIQDSLNFSEGEHLCSSLQSEIDFFNYFSNSSFSCISVYPYTSISLELSSSSNSLLVYSSEPICEVSFPNFVDFDSVSFSNPFSVCVQKNNGLISVFTFS